MRAYRLVFFIVLFFLLLDGIILASPERVALVIGNSSYDSSPLKNPVNDASDIAEVLNNLDFDVIKKTDADLRNFDEALALFYQKLQKAEVGLFFYSGHGVQIEGINYLIPVKTNIRNPNDIKYKTIDARRILGMMEDAGNKLNIVVLDACRNNPFRAYFRSPGNGLALMDAPDGTIIAYSTAPGSVASDGTGRNGLFTGYLLENLKRPDLDVLDLFNETGLDVKRETNGRQTPWMTNSPMDRYYLAGNTPDAVSDGSSGVTPEQDAGILKVTSEPSRADVQVNGRGAGQTPLLLSGIKPGTWHIAVSRSGYKKEERRVSVQAGRRVVVGFDLQREQEKGWLTVRPGPEDARVRILNKQERYIPGMELPAGRYHIEVSSPGYVTEKRWVDLAAGDDIQVEVDLDREKITTVARPSPRTDSYCVSGNCENGSGKEIYPDGSSYHGEFKAGKKNGYGTYKFTDGDSYAGDWKDNKMHGNGVYTWANGAEYDGEFENDLKHGRGTLSNHDGSSYIGEFRDGKFNGYGTYTFNDGRRQKGYWRNGQPAPE